MDSTTEARRSQRNRNPVDRFDPSAEASQPQTTQRPSSQRNANNRRKALQRGSVMEDIQAASVPVSYYVSNAHYSQNNAKFRKNSRPRSQRSSTLHKTTTTTAMFRPTNQRWRSSRIPRRSSSTLSRWHARRIQPLRRYQTKSTQSVVWEV